MPKTEPGFFNLEIFRNRTDRQTCQLPFVWQEVIQLMGSWTALAQSCKEMKVWGLHLTSSLTHCNVTIVPCLQQSQNCLNRWKWFQKRLQTKHQSRLRNWTAIQTQKVRKYLVFHVTLGYFVGCHSLSLKLQ